MPPTSADSMPLLARITVYPIKSLDGIEVSKVRILPSGALENDRRFKLVDGEGKTINGKRFPQLLCLRAEYNEAMTVVALEMDGRSHEFSLEHESEQLARWCSEVLDVECRCVENAETGFPDDTESPGPTLISAATLETVRSWFPEIDQEETRRRFRTNLELAEKEPFWEDRLLGPTNPSRQFRIGTTRWRADKVCQRCAVPGRDSRTGAATEGFTKRFTELRRQSLPEQAPLDMFDHYYRLAINTRLESLAEQSELRIGDEVQPWGDYPS